ncbi:hypothetical protein Droror1_Dr00016686 [Drosera rotundifolia]
MKFLWLDRSGANWLDRFTAGDPEAGWSAGHDRTALEAAGRGRAGEARPKEGGSRESDGDGTICAAGDG